MTAQAALIALIRRRDAGQLAVVGPSAKRRVGAVARRNRAAHRTKQRGRLVYFACTDTMASSQAQAERRASLHLDWLSDIRRACERVGPDASSRPSGDDTFCRRRSAERNRGGTAD